ncbi:MAG: hypothetical protein ABIH42_09715 [Planctomycetota bacterium]
MKKVLLLTLLCIGTIFLLLFATDFPSFAQSEKPEKVWIGWKFDKGTVREYEGTYSSESVTDIEIEKTKLEKEPTPMKLKTKSLITWKCLNVDEKGDIVSLAVDTQLTQADIKTPEGKQYNLKEKQLKNQSSLPEEVFMYIYPRIRYQWEISTEKKKLLNWAFINDDDSVGEREHGDPLGITDSYKQFPSAEVDLGGNWKHTTNESAEGYNQLVETTYTFKSVATKQERKCAVVEIKAEVYAVTVDNDGKEVKIKIGKGSGTIYHDIEKGCLVECNESFDIDGKIPLTGKLKAMTTIIKNKYNSLMVLKKEYKEEEKKK